MARVENVSISPFIKCGNRADDILYLFFCQLRINRERQGFLRCPVGHGEIVLPVPERTEAVLFMKRYRVIDFGVDAFFFEEILQRVPFFTADDVLMINMRPVRKNDRRCDKISETGIFKTVRVIPGIPEARFGPFGKVGQFRP